MTRASLLAAVLAAAACVPPGPGQSNGVKLGEALAFAAVAGAAQVAQSVAEQNARSSAPVRHASSAQVSQGCDNEGQYPCVTVTPGQPPERAAEPEMSADEARDYVLGYVNGVRRIHRIDPVVRDPALDLFAQAGSAQLAGDHRLGQHLLEHARELPGGSGELQGAAEGEPPGLLQDRIADVLLRRMDEGPGGMHHDLVLHPRWHRLGVGLVRADARIYVTVDFAD